eukprot:7666161-Karenia_brevis.AAC.1
MPILYRRWAATRLKHLAPWYSLWADDCMFAGLPGRSAEDAWYLTALDVESSLISDVHLVGGALDLYKCFDQVIRSMMYVILLLSGIPLPILTAYINYHEHVSCYFSIAGAFGAAHKFPCGIPQGCPLSMLFVALYLRPWILQMRHLQALPRALADDILLITVGPDALLKFSNAFNCTLVHLTDLGGRISSHKSKLFSTFAKFRRWLQAKNWIPL